MKNFISCLILLLISAISFQATANPTDFGVPKTEISQTVSGHSSLAFPFIAQKDDDIVCNQNTKYMTNLEALAGSVNQPVDQIKLQKILIDNGLKDTDEYIQTSKQFELSTASLYVLMVTTPNVSEGDYTLSMTDKAMLADMATAIYLKYGVENPLKPKPKVRNRSNYW